MRRTVHTSPFLALQGASVVYGRRVLHRIGHALLILALIGATGTHWALLQSVAWTTMLADNLRTLPLKEAMSRTFDGNHPCNICEHVTEGRRTEKKSDFPPCAKKLEFLSERPAFIFSAPAEFRLLPVLDDCRLTLTHKPPVPPPRSLAV